MVGKNFANAFKTTSAKVSHTISSGPDVKKVPNNTASRKVGAVNISSPLKGMGGCASCRKRK